MIYMDQFNNKNANNDHIYHQHSNMTSLKLSYQHSKQLGVY